MTKITTAHPEKKLDTLAINQQPTHPEQVRYIEDYPKVHKPINKS